MKEKKPPIGIAMPIEFKTTRLKRSRQQNEDFPLDFSWAPEKEFSWGPEKKRYVCSEVELYFSNISPTFDTVDLLEPGRTWDKERRTYIKNNFFGKHDILMPKKIEAIEKDRYIWKTKDRYSFGLLGEFPTTATVCELMQLLPSTKADFMPQFFNQMPAPFFIDIVGDEFFLCVICSDGRIKKVEGQKYTPRCWHGYGHPVATLQYENTYKPLFHFKDIPWDDIAELGCNY